LIGNFFIIHYHTIMEQHSLILTIFLIFAGAAIFSTLALYMRQSLLVAYMIFGIIFGPYGLKLITNVDLIHRVDDVGIISLMFLLGLHLKPPTLFKVVCKNAWVTIASSIIFFVSGFLVGYWYGYSISENLIIGSCVMFSSTIVSLKLLPAKLDGRQNTIDTMIGILLLQDLFAIMVLLTIDLSSSTVKGIGYFDLVLVVLSLPAILLFVYLVKRFILKKIFAKFSHVREYMFLVTVTWCLGIAVLAKAVGLSYEIGAFIAGVAVAASPLVIYIESQVQPIRDFFLVLFFFLIGTSFNLRYFNLILVPVVILTVIFIIIKPLVFSFLLRQVKETKEVAWEVGLRLSQLSEFSLLAIFAAERNELVGDSVVYLIQAVTMLMFIASSYIVVMRYPILDKFAIPLPEYEEQE
jgi:Kef-type K+ transport system membrane component KefB